MKTKTLVDQLIREARLNQIPSDGESIKKEIIDGYDVEIFKQSSTGKFYHLVGGSMYGGRLFSSVDKALEDANKVVQIRKTVDNKVHKPVDIQGQVAADFFKRNAKSGNPSS